jgi:hypothetical protein
LKGDAKATGAEALRSGEKYCVDFNRVDFTIFFIENKEGDHEITLHVGIPSLRLINTIDKRNPRPEGLMEWDPFSFLRASEKTDVILYSDGFS